jgi:hypothetical protein
MSTFLKAIVLSVCCFLTGALLMRLFVENSTETSIEQVKTALVKSDLELKAARRREAECKQLLLEIDTKYKSLLNATIVDIDTRLASIKSRNQSTRLGDFPLTTTAGTQSSVVDTQLTTTDSKTVITDESLANAETSYQSNVTMQDPFAYLWMITTAFKRDGHYFPKRALNVINHWARYYPRVLFIGIDTPLARSMVSNCCPSLH